MTISQDKIVGMRNEVYAAYIVVQKYVPVLIYKYFIVGHPHVGKYYNNTDWKMA